ncbi:transcriptional regulator [Novosphingobium endophyticum]|uniref:Transcriptional regulator n=1 Tax=Novosphingobium endophyticum TaxID=1955250 RepID=A0A916TTJ7_9SPHN|nr:Lrp/AsnC family transcriptional regulator [Novosphingobium endophyticum]GGC06836.1 transcriptional regulator [Novosphingobium endophyticum]
MNGLLDDLDNQLIAILSKDARVSNRKIATELGITEGTVRGRIKRLQSDGQIAFTAITGLSLAAKSRLAFIGIKAAMDKVREISDYLSAMDEINAVLVSLGELNITAICLFDELDELVELTSDRILTIAGVYQVETSIAVKTMKYNSRVARITNLTDDET